MNVELLRKTVDWICEHPEELSMGYWFYQTSDCKTVACLASHVCLVSGLKPQSADQVVDKEGFIVHVADAAVALLDITQGQANRLFNVNHWPSPHSFLSALPAQRPHILRDRVEYFIEHGK